MASSASPWKCCICLDDFSDPVTAPCGHNFCLACINAYWDGAAAAQCPLCQQLFKKRPQLRVNVMLRDLILQRSGGVQQGARKEGEGEGGARAVLCDACPAEGRRAAAGSCLQCEESLCKEHLRPHRESGELKDHELLEPVSRLGDRVCKQHKAPLELICRRDLTCVCVLCATTDHRDHKCSPLTKRLKRRKEQVQQELVEVKQEMKNLKAMERDFDESRDLSQRNTRADLADTMRIYAHLSRVMEVNRLALMTTLTVLQRKAENRIGSEEERLQEELSELEERKEELQRLSQSSGDLAFLKACHALSAPPNTSDWSEISAHSDAAVGTVRGGIGAMMLVLHKEAAEQMQDLVAKEIKRARQYAVDVTLDSNTANHLLIVSKDGKQVRKGATPQKLPDNEERFDVLLGVLGREGFSSGAFYFEVEAEGKESWDIGVALETVERKQDASVCLNSGYAVLMLRGGSILAPRDTVQVRINLPKTPTRVGVFVDHEEGEVGFYDVGNGRHIYSFTNCDFSKKKLHPYLNPCSSDEEGGNSAPMVITPLKAKSKKSDGGESVGARAAAGRGPQRRRARTSAGGDGGTGASVSEQRRPRPPADVPEQPEAADGAPQGGGGSDEGAALQSEKKEKGSDASEAAGPRRAAGETAWGPVETRDSCILS